METSWLVIWTITGLFGVGGVTCIGKGLKLHLCERADALRKGLEQRKDELTQQMKEQYKKKEELEKRGVNLGKMTRLTTLIGELTTLIGD